MQVFKHEYRVEADSPGVRWGTITGHASNALDPRPRALYISGDGDLIIAGDDGNDITFAVNEGDWVPLSPRYLRVSTATVVGIY